MNDNNKNTFSDKKRNKQKSADSSAGRIHFDFEKKGRLLIVHLSGEADLLGSSKLRQAIMPQLGSINRIVFDLSNLEFADSYFLRLLIVLRKRLGGVSSVIVKNAKPSVLRIFEVTGLDKLFIQSSA